MSNSMPRLSGHGQAALRALRRAHAKVVDQHRQWGEPMVVYRDGKVVFQPVGDVLQVAEEGPEYKTGRAEDSGGAK